LKVGGEEADEQEDRAEPSELGGELKEGAAAINAGDARVPVKEPIQSWV
jgi:hypothetical protein